MKRYIFISVILATFWACSKTIEFDDKGTGSLMVVNSLIFPDSCISGSLSQSTSILKDNRYGGFLEGTVSLYEDGLKVNEAKSLLGTFRFTTNKPKTGKTYRIIVSANGKEAFAETSIPSSAEVLSVDTSTIRNGIGGKILNCKLKFRDSAGEDFYRLIITDESLVLNYNSNEQIKTKYYLYQNNFTINFDDPVFRSLYNNFGSDIADVGPDNAYSIFPDDYFQGKEYSIQFTMPSFQSNNTSGYYGNPSNPNLNYYGRTLSSRRTIHFQKLSKAYFSYLKYFKLYEFYRDDPFAEPVPVFSNITGGAGIFASYNDDSKFVFQKIYIPYSMDTIKLEKQQQQPGYQYYK